MLFFGEPIFKHVPEPCPGNNCDYPVHGFGLSRERGSYIADAIGNLMEDCRDAQALTVDFPRLMAGPPELDLLSPTEVLAAGYLLGLANTALTGWIDEVNPEHSLPEWAQGLARAARASGGIVQVNTVTGDDLGHVLQEFFNKRRRKAEGDTEDNK